MKQLTKRTKSHHQKWKPVLKSPRFKFEYSHSVLTQTLVHKLNSLSLVKAELSKRELTCKRQLDLQNGQNGEKTQNQNICFIKAETVPENSKSFTHHKDLHVPGKTESLSNEDKANNIEHNDNDSSPDELAIYLDNFLVLPEDRMSSMAEMMYM